MSNRIECVEMKSRLQLYLVMGSVNCLCDPEVVLHEAIQGGITIFQFREKGPGALQGREKYELAKKLQKLCREGGIPFIVNDDVELALRLEADGVHVGQEDEQAGEVRRKIGDKIMGVSAHNLDEARMALELGADYLGVGPMYATKTKLDAREVQGPSLIRHLRDHGIAAPLVGIGGIAPGGVGPIVEAGADGVAVISAISQAEDARGAAGQLFAEVREGYVG
jgi:thiamine-phosphate pyrophosphorylase